MLKYSPKLKANARQLRQMAVQYRLKSLSPQVLDASNSYSFSLGKFLQEAAM